MDIQAKNREEVNQNLERVNIERCKDIICAMTYEEKKAAVSVLPADLMFAEIVRRYSNMEIRENAIKDILVVEKR